MNNIVVWDVPMHHCHLATTTASICFVCCLWGCLRCSFTCQPLAHLVEWFPLANLCCMLVDYFIVDYFKKSATSCQQLVSLTHSVCVFISCDPTCPFTLKWYQHPKTFIHIEHYVSNISFCSGLFLVCSCFPFTQLEICMFKGQAFILLTLRPQMINDKDTFLSCPFNCGVLKPLI